MNKFLSKKLLLLMSVSVFLLSCMDNKYDIDELNKEAVWSPGGINLPIGNVKPFLLENELKKLFDDETVLKTDGNGVLYMEYSGSFAFDIPDIATTLDEGDLSQGVNVPMSSALTTLITSSPIKLTGAIQVAPTTSFSYDLPEPDIEAGSEWDFTVDSVGLTNCSLKANFTLGFNVDDRGTKTKLKVVFTFPPEFVLKNSGNTITKEIDLGTENNVLLAELAGFNSTNTSTNVSYSIELAFGDNTYVSRRGSAAPYFDMELFVTNPQLTTIKARVSIADQEIADDKIEIGDLSEALGEHGIIVPDNPSLTVTANTNLDLGLEIVPDKIKAVKNGTSVREVGGGSTYMKIPANTPSVYLFAAHYDGSVPENHFISLDIGSLVKEKPDEIAYSFKANAITDKVVYFQAGNINLTADYTFKIPFSFREINLDIEPVILEDVFDGDIAEDIFKENSGGVTIYADTALISIGDNDSDLSINFNIAYLDEDKNVIKDKTQIFKSGVNTLNFSEENLANLKNARHIQFSVQIVKADNGRPLTFTDRDKIVIRKLKIKKTGGLPFDL
jgi:hypothetical protein